jgi:hypothetical protein
MLLLDAHKNTLPNSKLIDLQEATNSSGAPSLSIKKSLEPEAYGIDLSLVKLKL